MDYPERKRRPKRGNDPRDVQREEPELRLAEFTAPCGEELPWRTFATEASEIVEGAPAQNPLRGRLH